MIDYNNVIRRPLSEGHHGCGCREPGAYDESQFSIFQLLISSCQFFSRFQVLISSCQFSSCWLLSAVCNCRLTVGISNRVNHPPTSQVSGFGGVPEIIKNPSKFQPLPVPSKTIKSEPRVTKSLPKWCPKPAPGNLNLKLSPNCKSNKNMIDPRTR